MGDLPKHRVSPGRAFLRAASELRAEKKNYV